MSDTTDEAMADEESQAATEEAKTDADSSSGDAVMDEPNSSDEGSADVEVSIPEFANMQETLKEGAGRPINRFYDVSVTVWAELGRVELPLGDIVKLAQGSVLKLGRPISAPVDLMAQGVRVARGEVVIVDDCFAIRIKEIETSADAKTK
ncbi:MAG: FliM/FliN family flagellar motor switch protein [Planctomycetales bacterium]|nr:FliM/FliN family flagellar motor switch protein [Planctomycetales bacterium]